MNIVTTNTPHGFIADLPAAGITHLVTFEAAADGWLAECDTLPFARETLIAMRPSAAKAAVLGEWLRLVLDPRNKISEADREWLAAIAAGHRDRPMGRMAS